MPAWGAVDFGWWWEGDRNLARLTWTPDAPGRGRGTLTLTPTEASMEPEVLASAATLMEVREVLAGWEEWVVDGVEGVPWLRDRTRRLRERQEAAT